MRLRSLAPLVFASLAAGCSSSSSDGSAPTGPAAPAPAGNPHNVELAQDQRCPGDPGCAPADDPTFYAGAAAMDISPTVDHTVQHAAGVNPWDFNPGAGDQCVDGQGNPAPATACTWMAGFGNGRPAVDVNDKTYARCVVVKQGNTKIGLCTVDAVGWFYSEIERTRELIAQSNPEVDLDLLVVAATHDHETEDTLGQWGPDTGTRGAKKEYNQMIREKTRDALVAADKALQPVKLVFGAIAVDGHLAQTDPHGLKTQSFVSDTRDPCVLDNELRTIRMLSKDGKTVATMMNWASHPEFAGSENVHVTADWVGGLRDAIESGFDDKDPQGNTIHQDGYGGVAIVFNGALGGQVGPGEVKEYGFDDVQRDRGIDMARTNGRKLSVYAAESQKTGATTLETAQLGFRARELYLDIDNKAFHIALAQNLFDRDAYFYDKTQPIGEGNIPVVKTQEAVIDIGPAELLTIPGELHAELLLAKPDGTTSLDAPYPFTPAPYLVLNDPAKGNPNCEKDGSSRCDSGPPDISKMDRTVVLDRLRDPKSQYHWVLGLAQDELGYVVPKYDYKLDPNNPFFDEASPGDHYEETNSVGPKVESDMLDPLRQMLKTAPVVTR